MTRTEYFETAQRLYNEGKISAEAYDALWLNAEEFIDEDDDDDCREPMPKLNIHQSN